jgi:hypothetical protein
MTMTNFDDILDKCPFRIGDVVCFHAKEELWNEYTYDNWEIKNIYCRDGKYIYADLVSMTDAFLLRSVILYDKNTGKKYMVSKDEMSRENNFEDSMCNFCDSLYNMLLSIIVRPFDCFRDSSH